MADKPRVPVIEIHHASTLQALGVRELDFEKRGHLVRHVRGQFCETWQDLHREFSSAFQFPWYYGNNLPALVECLSEIGEKDPTLRGIVVSVWDSGHLLAREVDRYRSLQAFEEILDDVGREMKMPTGITAGEELVSREFTLLMHDERGPQDSVPRNLVEAVVNFR